MLKYIVIVNIAYMHVKNTINIKEKVKKIPKLSFLNLKSKYYFFQLLFW